MMSRVTVTVERAPYAVWRAMAATMLVLPGAAWAHLLAGGELPHAPTLVGLAAAVFAAGLMVLRGSVSWRVLLPAVAAAQVGLHESFGAMQSMGSNGAHAGHGHMVGADATWTWQMVAAHTAVTLVTALAWRLCDRAAAVIVTLVDSWATSVFAGPDLRWSDGESAVAAAPVFLVSAPRRGPPPRLGHA
jgi:hypothetical protein